MYIQAPFLRTVIAVKVCLRMDNDTQNANISEHELKVLVKALTKSVEYIHKKHIIITFITNSAYAKKVKLNIKDLGKIYSKAQKGSLEVWVFF